MTLDMGKLEGRGLKVVAGDWGDQLRIDGKAERVLAAIVALKITGTLFVESDPGCSCCGPDYERVAEVVEGELLTIQPLFDEDATAPKMKPVRAHQIRNSQRSRETLPDGAGRKVAKQKAALGDRRYGKLLIQEALLELH